MEEDIKNYLYNISKEDLIKDWANVHAEKEVEEKRKNDPFWISDVGIKDAFL